MAAIQFRRSIAAEAAVTLLTYPKYIQFLVGPRQSGKTTLALQLAGDWPGPVHVARVEDESVPRPGWIREQADVAAGLAMGARKACLLVVDEIQKAPRWSEELKAIWDREQASPRQLRILALGSSALLMQKGLSESLAGRFMLTRVTHWSYPEMRDAFGFSLDDWLVFGSYPAGAELTRDPDRWRSFVRDGLIETALARDVMQMQDIRKPALLRSLFSFAATHPAQIVAYEKIQGQLQDAGNTTTLAHYLRLLETAFLASGLEPFRGNAKILRGGKPKLVAWNNALIHGMLGLPKGPLDPGWRGRIIENAVIAQFLNQLPETERELWYWREKDKEVDLVLRYKQRLWAIEVKSGREGRVPGLAAFRQKYPKAEPLVLGGAGVPLEEFFDRGVGAYVG